MKKVSKLLSIVLSLALCLSMIAPAFAAEDGYVDAYYYVQVTNIKNPPEEIDKSEPGTGSNGEWVFMGKGTVSDDIAKDAPLNDQGKNAPETDKNSPAKIKLDNGKLPEGFTAPEAGDKQEFETGQYYNWDADDEQQGGDTVTKATVEAFHDIGQYQYDDETADEAASKFTYTVVWTSVGKCANTDATERGGFDFDGSECASVTVEGREPTGTPDAGRICFQGNGDGGTIHVNGEATLHKNAVIKVEVVGYENGSSTEGQEVGSDTKYVRDTDAKNLEAQNSKNRVEAVANNLAGDYADGVEKGLYALTSAYDEKSNTVIATYTEQTYMVTYAIENDDGVTLNWDEVLAELNKSTEKGKVSEAWANIGTEMLKAVVKLPTSGDGTYKITDWEAKDDGKGGYTISAKCSYTPNTPNPPAPPVPVSPTVTIDDPEVPLAGLFTRADAIGYLWEQAGSPDAELSDFADVPEDHQWAVAIGWAQDNGIAVADLEGNFRPDDLILRSVEDIELSPEGELEQFLNRYAVHAGIELDEGELFIELDGSWDDIIMGEDAQVIFDEFFVRLELALAQAA